MVQTEIETPLDARTRIGSGQAGQGSTAQNPKAGKARQAAKSPLAYAAVVTAAYLLRKQIFSAGGLFFAVGFYAARQLKTKQLPGVLGGALQGLVKEQATFTIDKPAAELYSMWHAVENSPNWMESIRSVTPNGTDPKVSHWVMDLPGGAQLEWDAEWTAEEAGQRLAWRTIGDPQIPSAGQIVFEPAESGRGTVVRVNQEFLIPGGKVAAALGGMFSRTPGGFVRENLRHFKQLAEAGEVATTKGQPVGTRGAATKLAQAVEGDREQQKTSPKTGGIVHQEVA